MKASSRSPCSPKRRSEPLGVARGGDQRIGLADAALEVGEQQPFADAEGRDDELAGLEALDQLAQQHRRLRQGGQALAGR